MGLYETQNRLGQSETLMLFFSKNKLISSQQKIKFVFHFAPCSTQPRSPLYDEILSIGNLSLMKNNHFALFQLPGYWLFYNCSFLSWLDQFSETRFELLFELCLLKSFHFLANSTNEHEIKPIEPTEH
jgi:hypothetical protein